MQAVSRSRRVGRGWSWTDGSRPAAFPGEPRRTPCVIRLPRTFWRAAPTYAPCRSCLATRTSPPPRSTRTSPTPPSETRTALPTPARLGSPAAAQPGDYRDSVSGPTTAGDSLEGIPDTTPVADGATEQQPAPNRPSTGRVLAQASLILTAAALA